MAWRESFNYPPPPARYFLSHSVGLQPKAARDSMERCFWSDWSAGSDGVWDTWLKTILEFRQAIAALIGGAEDEVCPQTNISSALTKVLHSLPRSEGRNRIVLCREDFPTIGFVATAAEKLGFSVDFIEGGEALADPAHWARAIREDVFLVHLTHVYSNSALRAPVREISKLAKAAGAWCVIDVAQSAGVIPIDVKDWSADFVTGTSVKYLCGGPGAAWLWAHPDASRVAAPIDVGWFSHASPFEFEIMKFRYASGALRFWGGTPSVAPFALATAGIETVRAMGVDKISLHTAGLIDSLVINLPKKAILSHTEPGEHGAHVIVRPVHIKRASKILSTRGFLHDSRAGGLRFSCHCYTNEEDVFDLLRQITPLL